MRWARSPTLRVPYASPSTICCCVCVTLVCACSDEELSRRLEIGDVDGRSRHQRVQLITFVGRDHLRVPEHEW